MIYTEIFRLIIMMVIIAIFFTGSIFIIRLLKSPGSKSQLAERDMYFEMTMELKGLTREVRTELAQLREKVESIEKILLEVE